MHALVFSVDLVFHMSIIWIYVMSHVCPASWPFVLHGKNFDTGHYMQTFQPDFFTPATLIGTIDFYFIPHSLTLTLRERSQCQRIAKSICFLFLHTFHLSRLKFDVKMKQFKLNILRLKQGKQLLFYRLRQ